MCTLRLQLPGVDCAVRVQWFSSVSSLSKKTGFAAKFHKIYAAKLMIYETQNSFLYVAKKMDSDRGEK